MSNKILVYSFGTYPKDKAIKFSVGSESVLDMHLLHALVHDKKVLLTLEKLNRDLDFDKFVVISLSGKKAFIGDVHRSGVFGKGDSADLSEYRPLSQFNIEDEMRAGYVWMELKNVEQVAWSYIEHSISTTGNTVFQSLNSSQTDVFVKEWKNK